MDASSDIMPLAGPDPLDRDRFGARALRLSTMASHGIKIPVGFALSVGLVRQICDGSIEDVRSLLESAFEDMAKLGQMVVRGSPQDPAWGGPAVVTGVEGIEELLEVIASTSAAWMQPTSKILRQAAGAPPDAGLGLIVHQMALGTVEQYQSVDEESGADLTADFPQDVTACLTVARKILSDAPTIEVVRSDAGMTLIGAFPAKRKARAEVQIVVDLVSAGILTKKEALLRVNPRSLTEQLHPQIENSETVTAVANGIGGSPGAAQGGIVFTAEAAQAAHAQGQKAILVRTETSPEDIRGMHSAAGVLTLTGGTSSHAAVIAQGIGVPCVVGASSLQIDIKTKTLALPGGQTLEEGALITIDGADGRVIEGALKLSHKPLSEAFSTLMKWADETRTIGVRANADTLQEAKTAKRFEVDGIGLCRTEHMFYEEDRINVMREMILAETRDKRAAALSRLMPMQRKNFVELFELMEGAPVTIRLLDPPLHEFLPKGTEEIMALARSMDEEVETLGRRIEELEEFNPMLGMRGVRLGVTMPEIYEMQTRAIFEAAADVASETGREIVPEIMIPLVSAQKEAELVKSRIELVADQIANETGRRPAFHLGVMVETPRAALRAGDLSSVTSFLSFGTNDLTQMTYGLSRDDAGRFMREYVNAGLYPEDPFLTLDIEGVGELLLIAAKRGRASNPEIELGLCGEHGGDPASVQFCRVAGFDYVSCSPFRVPVARLAAAQASLLAE